jgi:rhodanese-related sulfurtransferase
MVLDIILKCLVVAIMLAGIIAITGCSSNRTVSEQTIPNVQSQQLTQDSSQARPGFSDLDSAKAKELIDADKDLQIIDVREQFEFAMGHIHDAKLIPVGRLESRMGEIDKTKPILLYCATGSRSRAAAQFLAQAGYSKIYNLKLGIVRWNYDIEK